MQLNNPTFMDELANDPTTKKSFRENLIKKNTSENFFQMKLAFNKNTERKPTNENLNNADGCQNSNTQTSSLNNPIPTENNPISDSPGSIYQQNSQYLSCMKDLIEHTKKVHLKVLTYSIGRILTEKEVDQYVKSNLIKRDEDGNPVNLNQTNAINNLMFDPTRMKNMCHQIKYFLDMLFAFIAKYIDESEKKQVKTRTKNYLDDYREVSIFNSLKINNLESINDYLKNLNLEKDEKLIKNEKNSLSNNHLYQFQIKSLKTKVIDLAKELESRKIAIIELKSNNDKKENQIENLRMKTMGTQIVENKLNHMGNKFFDQVSFIFNKYTDVVSYLNTNVDKIRNIWNQIIHDKNPQSIINRHNYDFVRFFKCLKDAVENYEFNKHKVNLKIYKNFIEDFDLKNYKLDLMINKKIMKNLNTIELQRDDDKCDIISDTDKILNRINESQSTVENIKQNYVKKISSNENNAYRNGSISTPNIINREPLYKFNKLESETNSSNNLFFDKKRQGKTSLKKNNINTFTYATPEKLYTSKNTMEIQQEDPAQENTNTKRSEVADTFSKNLHFNSNLEFLQYKLGKPQKSNQNTRLTAEKSKAMNYSQRESRQNPIVKQGYNSFFRPTTYESVHLMNTDRTTEKKVVFDNEPIVESYPNVKLSKSTKKMKIRKPRPKSSTITADTDLINNSEIQNMLYQRKMNHKMHILSHKSINNIDFLSK